MIYGISVPTLGVKSVVEISARLVVCLTASWGGQLPGHAPNAWRPSVFPMSRSISVILCAACGHLTACEVVKVGYERCLDGPNWSVWRPYCFSHADAMILKGRAISPTFSLGQARQIKTGHTWL